MLHTLRSVALALVGVVLPVASVSSMPQTTPACAPTWLPTFGGQPGTSQSVTAMAVFDDGSGPALFAGGGFVSAGGTASRRFAKWNGSSWLDLGADLDGGINALAVFDDGAGRALYAGGSFTTANGVLVNGIAKWNGSSWSALGAGLALTPSTTGVAALTVFDDGSGSALYVAGQFTAAGGVAANGIAKWNGSSWSPLGNGASTYSPSGVRALTTFDDGSGSALYAGGTFASAGGVTVNGIAKWNGSNWSALGSGVSGSTNPVSGVGALCVFDDGSGAALYAAGGFTTAGGLNANGIAKWSGTSWSAMGSGLGFFYHDVSALSVFDDGSGPMLYAGGFFGTGGPGFFAHGIVRWNGVSWTEVGGGLRGNGRVFALAFFDDGGGPALFAGGDFSTDASDVALSNIAKWNGSNWTPLGQGLNERVNAIAIFDDGTGPALYAAGRFSTGGGQSAKGIAKWNGSTWSAVGGGLAFESVAALKVFDDGTGPALFATGVFTTAGSVPAHWIAKWDGTSWSALGSGLTGPSSAGVGPMEVFDDGSGPALYVGGPFSFAGGVPANNIAKWNGSTWSALGSGLGGPAAIVVRSMQTFDDGSGPALYVCGNFTIAGGLPVTYVARWNGSNWSQVDAGLNTNGLFTSLTVYDDGSGPALFGGGLFWVNPNFSYSVVKWNGSSWSQFGTGLEGAVYDFAEFDDGSGTAWYAGGQFFTSGVTGAKYLAKWNGSNWTQFGDSLDPVYALTTFDDGTGSALYLGGKFATSPAGDSFIAKWGNPCPSGAAYCLGDGSGTPCACSNLSNPNDQAGCLNALGNGGKLTASGIAKISADTLVLAGSAMPNGGALYFQGPVQTSGGGGIAFGDGLRCVSGSIVRLAVKFNVAGASQFPAAGDPTLSSAGLVSVPGTRNYQVWYRDSAAFCTVATHNLSNGWKTVWSP